MGFSQENTHTVYFDTDLSKVTNIEENRLLSFIASLSEKNVLSIEIFGFCDESWGQLIQPFFVTKKG